MAVTLGNDGSMFRSPPRPGASGEPARPREGDDTAAPGTRAGRHRDGHKAEVPEDRPGHGADSFAAHLRTTPHAAPLAGGVAAGEAHAAQDGGQRLSSAPSDGGPSPDQFPGGYAADTPFAAPTRIAGGSADGRILPPELHSTGEGGSGPAAASAVTPFILAAGKGLPGEAGIPLAGGTLIRPAGGITPSSQAEGATTGGTSGEDAASSRLAGPATASGSDPPAPSPAPSPTPLPTGSATPGAGAVYAGADTNALEAGNHAGTTPASSEVPKSLHTAGAPAGAAPEALAAPPGIPPHTTAGQPHKGRATDDAPPDTEDGASAASLSARSGPARAGPVAPTAANTDSASARGATGTVPSPPPREAGRSDPASLPLAGGTLGYGATPAPGSTSVPASHFGEHLTAAGFGGAFRGDPGSDPDGGLEEGQDSGGGALGRGAEGASGAGQPGGPVQTLSGPAPGGQGSVAALTSQVGHAILSARDGVTELHLVPGELGKVRFRLRSEAGHLVVVISAERPETLALMRRHAEDLAAELRGAGFGRIDLSFGSGADSFAGGRSPDGPGSGASAGSTAGPEPAAGGPPPLAPRHSGDPGASLYLRL